MIIKLYKKKSSSLNLMHERVSEINNFITDFPIVIFNRFYYLSKF